MARSFCATLVAAAAVVNPISAARAVSRRSALSERSSSRYSARLVNMR